MATSSFSFQRFFGARYGLADNLVQDGFAAEAVNVDTSDGALQTMVGVVPYPDVLDEPDLKLDPTLMWETENGYAYFLYDGTIVRVYQTVDFLTGITTTHAATVYTPETLAERNKLRGCERLFQTTISGERVVIGLRRRNYIDEMPGPIVIGYEESFYVRDFGTGMFITSDAVTELVEANSTITGVKIGRVMTDDEVKRCVYAGVYIMADEDDELDYTASYVSGVELGSNYSIITFMDPMASGSVSVGHYIKVRGGLSNQPVSYMCSHFGRLFAAGDRNYPNRLYWSCLPGDSRTIEDWTADDASADTGGGYVQVGTEGYITALFSFQSQLLIWCGDELWRLYGATPSQYTLERVYAGAGQSLPKFDYGQPLIMQDRIADVHGVPYVVLDTGLYYYDGSSLQRVDNDRTVQAYLQLHSGEKVRNYGMDLSREISNVRYTTYWNGGIYFRRTSCVEKKGELVKYDLTTGSITTYDLLSPIAATRRGLLACCGDYDSNLSLLLDGVNAQDGQCILSDDSDETNWEQRYHKLAGAPIDAAWESQDLSFGDVSTFKKLRRIGLDVTGPIRVIIKAPEGVLFDKSYPMSDIRTRRILWLAPDMPYTSVFRIRFESVDGQPFRVHNGASFNVELNPRN